MNDKGIIQQANTARVANIVALAEKLFIRHCNIYTPKHCLAKAKDFHEEADKFSQDLFQQFSKETE